MLTAASCQQNSRAGVLFKSAPVNGLIRCSGELEGDKIVIIQSRDKQGGFIIIRHQGSDNTITGSRSDED